MNHDTLGAIAIIVVSTMVAWVPLLESKLARKAGK